MTEQRSGTGHFGRRLLALLMALVMLLSMYLGYRAQIRFSGLNYVGQISEYAARVTADNTGYLSRSTLDRAWTILRATIRSPQTCEDYEMYASIAIAREDYAGATEYLQGCIDTYQGSDDEELATLYLRQAGVYVLTENYGEALVRLDRTLELNPAQPSALLLRAQMNYMAGDTQKALEDLTAYKALDNSDPVILAALGEVYEGVGDYDSAIECYTAGITDEAAYQTHYFVDRARCLLLTGDAAAAREDLETYFTREGEDPDGEAAAMLAMCRMNDGDYAGALAMFHRSATDGYAAPHLLYSQSMLCAFLCGEYETATRDGEKAIELTEAAGEDSADLRFRTGLAYMVQQAYDLAVEHFTAAVQRDETLQDVSYYLGVCAMGQEDLELAVEHFTASVEKDESVTVSLYNRAICYLQLGKRREAKSDLTAVLERDDDPELTAQAQELLDSL